MNSQPKLAKPCRWLRRGLWALLMLVVLMIMLHRPLLRLAVGWVGQHYAAANNFQLAWKVTGSMTSDLSVGDMLISGAPNSAIRQLQWRRASVDYSLWEMITQGFAKGVHGLTLADANIELVLPLASGAKPHGAKPVQSSAGLPDIWLRQLDLRNINARIITGDGDIVLRGFTLLLDETKTGTLEIEDLTVPATGLHLSAVHGKTEIKGRTVILTDLVFTPDMDVPRFTMDLLHWQKGSLPFQLLAHSGKATIKSSGRVDDLSTSPSLDVTLALSQLAHTDVARWMKLPKDTTWMIESAELRVIGPLAKPQMLNGTLALAASDIHAANVHCDHLSGRAVMTHGVVKVESLDLHLDDLNKVALTGDVNPADRQHAVVSWNANFGNLASIIPIDDLPDMRWLATSGTATFDIADMIEGKFNKITSKGTAEVDELTWRQRRMERASLAFQLHEGQAELSKLDLRLDAMSSISITGMIGLADRQAFNLQWQAEAGNLAVVAPWLGIKDTPLPSAGMFTSQGKASGAMADLRAQKYQGLIADGMAHMTGVVWQDARLEDASLNFSCRDEHVEVKKLEVRLNERNTLTAMGHVKLDTSGEFDAEASATLDQLADFSGWMELAKQPRITSGSAALAWKGTGKIAQHEITGAGSVNIANLKLEGRTEVFALALETRHAGQRAEITTFKASSGTMRAEASMTLTDTDLTIPQLVLFSGETRLIDGSAEVPLALSQTLRPAVPLDASRPMKVHLHMAKMKVEDLFMMIGQKPPVTGMAAMDLDLTGTLPELGGRLTATLSNARTDATKGKLEPALVQLEATLAKRMLTIKSTVRQKPLQTLTADAELPFDMEKLISAPGSFLDTSLKAHGILPKSDLSWVPRLVPAIAAINGTLSADVLLSGSLHKPEWHGAVQADAQQVAIKDSDMDIRNVKARTTFTGQRLTLDDVSASLSGGEMRAGGTVELTFLTDPILNLHLDVKQALIVRNDTMSLRADGNLTCTGPLAKADVKGRVELVRGRVFKEIEFLPLSLPDQLPSPPAMVRIVSATPSAPTPFAQWNFNVDIVTREPIRLLGNVLNGGAVANFHVSGTGALPVLEGKFSQQGANVKLPFSTLALSRGDIIFTREKPFEPQLDLQGDSLVNNYQVTVFATGSAAHPTLRFTSSPPLSEPEIATLLATGTAGGNAQSAGGVAANRAAFLVVSKAYHKLFGKSTSSRQAMEPAGRTSFNFNPLSSGASQASVSGTYEITPNWQAEVGVGERGFRGMLNYLVRFR